MCGIRVVHDFEFSAKILKKENPSSKRVFEDGKIMDLVTRDLEEDENRNKRIEHTCAIRDERVRQVVLLGPRDGEHTACNRRDPEVERLRLWGDPVVYCLRSKRDVHRKQVKPQGPFRVVPCKPHPNGSATARQRNSLCPSPMPLALVPENGREDANRSQEPSPLEFRVIVSGLDHKDKSEEVQDEDHEPCRQVLDQVVGVDIPRKERGENESDQAADEPGRPLQVGDGEHTCPFIKETLPSKLYHYYRKKST